MLCKVLHDQTPYSLPNLMSYYPLPCPLSTPGSQLDLLIILETPELSCLRAFVLTVPFTWNVLPLILTSPFLMVFQIPT